MAIERRTGSVALLLSVENGMTSEGAPIYKNITLNRINPAITDEDLYECGAALGDLQALPFAGVGRREIDTLVSA